MSFRSLLRVCQLDQLGAFAESDAGGDTLTDMVVAWSRPTDSTHSHQALDQAATASTTLPVRVDALPLLPLHRQGHTPPPSHHPISKPFLPRLS